MFKSTLDYHNLTSYDRFDMKGHYMDWPHQPSVFKEYTGADLVGLAPGGPYEQVSIPEFLLNETRKGSPSSMDFSVLSSILHLSHSITAKAKYGGNYFYYRSVASAGALYPFETYVWAMNLPGIDGGLYHHNIARDGLEQLRHGGEGFEVRELLGSEDTVIPTLVFFVSAIFFRSSWKYRDRAYRYHLLDSGHLLENLTLALEYHGLDYDICYDFKDTGVNQFLHVDPAREVCLAAVIVQGRSVSETTTENGPKLPATDFSVYSKVSSGEVDYPAIRSIHSLTTKSVNYQSIDRKKLANLGLPLKFETKVNIRNIASPSIGYPDAVFGRRSLRNFIKKQVSTAQIDYLLSITGFADPASNGIQTGLIVSDVEGLANGFYLYDANDRSLFEARKGDLIDDMTHICLDQAWLANCAAHFLIMANMREIECQFGPRGYRRALLTAGRLGQRLYIGATSLMFGCCGIGAFYDSEASKLLGLNDDSRLVYLLGVGPIKKRSGTTPQT